MTNRSAASFFRYVIDQGCLCFGTLLFFLNLGAQTLLSDQVVFTFATFVKQGSLSILSGGVWACLMWFFVMPHPKMQKRHW